MKDGRDTTVQRVKKADHQMLKREANRVPCDVVDFITAMCRLWESSPEKKRLAALRRVRSPELAAA